MGVLTQCDIADGLRHLGLCDGDKVLVHSSMIALGTVEGGADAVIDALLEVVGPSGLLVVPTFACKSPFDRRSSSTPLGAVADRLWRRPNAVRSSHPTHSVAAIGNGAEELSRGHENAPTAYGEGTPYFKLARSGGKILLLGVDQDRNTTLHAAEAIVGAAYLNDIEGSYIDDDGRRVTIPVAAMAGPHRDFIGLDKLFRERGIMSISRIGNAVCRLMDAGSMLDAAIDALRRDPSAVLCSNPSCADCVMQRGKIKATRLSNEEFMLAAVAGDISDDPGEVLEALRGEGISAVEISALDYNAFGKVLVEAGIRIVAVQSSRGDDEASALAERLAVPLIMPVSNLDDFQYAARLASGLSSPVLITNTDAPSSFYVELYGMNDDAPGLAFSPGGFAVAGEKPFLQVFYKGLLRKRARHFYIDDCRFDGVRTLPGQGNGEVKEIISMLRCRSYNGVMTLRSHSPGVPAFRQAAAAFWDMLDNM